MTNVNRTVTLASLAKVARNAGTNFRSVVAFVVSLGWEDDTKDTLIENYAAGLLDMKASQVATLRLRASPDAKAPNAHGQRLEREHKAIRNAEVFCIRVRDAAGFKPKATDGRARNAAKPAAAPTAPTAAESKARPQTLEAISIPTVATVDEGLAWLLQISIKAKTFRNQNAKMFDSLGDPGMAIRDALAALTKAIDASKVATKKARVQSKVAPAPVAAIDLAA